MSNIVNSSYEINYISQHKKMLCGRNQQTIYQKFKIDNRIQDTYYFQIVSKNNQLVNLSGFNYEFFGSFIDAKNNQHVLFYSDDFKIEDNVLSFKVNTYNSQYLNYVKIQRQIDLTIKKKTTGVDQVILRDTGIAYPSPIYEGEEPSPVVAGFGLEKNGYIMSLTGTVLSGDDSTIAINDNVISYIGPSGTTYYAGTGIGISDQNVISLTTTIPSAISQLTNDSDFINYLIGGEGISCQYWTGHTRWKVSLTNPIPTSASQLTNDVGYLTAVPSTYALKTDIQVYTAGQGIGIENNVISLTGSTGQTYTAGTGIGISDQNVISLTATIPTVPTNVSDFDNDAGYISGIDLTIYNSSSEQKETQNVTSIQFSDNDFQSSQGQILLKNPIPTAVSDLQNDVGYLTGLNTGVGLNYSSSVNTLNLTNKQDYGSVNTILSTGQRITYTTDKFIFDRTMSTTNGQMIINPFTIYNNRFDNGVATFELWLTPSGNLTGISIGSGLSLIGQLPSGYTSRCTQAFTVRLYKNTSGVIKQYIHYEYEFDKGEQPEPTPPEPPTPVHTPLTFKAINGSTTVTMNKDQGEHGGPYQNTFEYNKNDTGWTSYTPGTDISLNTNETVAFRGLISGTGLNKGDDDKYSFSFSDKVDVYGDINSLVNYGPIAQDWQYCNMFWGANIRSASGLNFPDLDLMPKCYRNMFRYSSIEEAPVSLPATGLAEECYLSMFEDCSNLSTAPAILPATTLADYCYAWMFHNDINLIVAPTLPATTLTSYCYRSMFESCSNLISITVAFTNWSDGTSNWMYDINSNGTFYCPAALGDDGTINRGNDYVANSFTVVNV